MSNYVGKALSSRILKAQNLAWTGAGTVVSTNFTSQTYQCRVLSQVAGYIAIDNTGTSISTASLPDSGVPINANGTPDVFTVSPGQLLEFTSTSTSSGNVGVTELS